jgi:hypothetical protein
MNFLNVILNILKVSFTYFKYFFFYTLEYILNINKLLNKNLIYL